MQITEMTLENWGPFYGSHTIDLTVSDAAPVILFHGENGRGKTSLLRAIIWSLYGELREQDGRTRLRVERMVNLNALDEGETNFGVTLRFSHGGVNYSLHRSAVAVEDRPGTISLFNSRVDLKPDDANPFPAEQVRDKIESILSNDVSDFFFFDGEMLTRFEERLREEQRSNGDQFVRRQVEKALGLPFLKSLDADLEAINTSVTTSMNAVLRKAKKYDELTDKFNAQKDALDSVERNLGDLRRLNEGLVTQIAEKDEELAAIDKIKDLYYERKAAQKSFDASQASIRDLRASLAEHVENTWWLPAAEPLFAQFTDADDQISQASGYDKERFKLEFRIGHLRDERGTGLCPTCGQVIATHDDRDFDAEIAALEAEMARIPSLTVEQARIKRDRLRRFGNAAGVVERVFEIEQDIARVQMQADRDDRRIREISDLISDDGVNVEVLEATLRDLKEKQGRTAKAIDELEKRRSSLRQDVNGLGAQIAEQPEVDPTERRLQQAVVEALDVTRRAYDGFSDNMRARVAEATSALFRRLTTEKEYQGVRINKDYALTVVDDQGRSQINISAGNNQILTTAFIGALGECSVEEAPMVMDTPLGRLDTGHREGILEWVSGFTSQVILFVQSGEYSSERDTHLLRGRIGREYTIARIGVANSEVRVA